MVKSKSSSTSAQRARLAYVDSWISENKPKVDRVVSETKRWLLNDYADEDSSWISEKQAAQVVAALEDYEPTVTELEISEIVYGDTTRSHVQEVMGHLETTIIDEELGMDPDRFYITWNALKRMTDERKRIIAGQLPLF